MSISDFAKNEPENVKWTTAKTTDSADSDPAPVKNAESSPTVTPTKNEDSSSTDGSTTVTSTEQALSPSPQTPTFQVNPSANTDTPNIDNILAKAVERIAPIGSNANFKLMVIGPPGQGKSSYMATAPNMLIYDFEDGLISAKESPHGVAPGTQAMPYVSFEEFTAIVQGFQNQNPLLKDYTVFGIDTLSDLHKRFLQEICDRDWRRTPSRNRYVPDTDQYTEVNERILRVVRALRDLPMDVIITSHSKTVTPKNSVEQTYADFSESLSNKVMAQMDIVGYMQFKKIDNKMVPVLRTKTEGTIRCKSRINLPDEIVDPTYGMLRAAWEESKNR